MKCDTGQLQAYLDEALSPRERIAVDEHLAHCAACQEELATLRQQAMTVARQLATLDPQPAQDAAARQALARFWGRVRPAGRQVTRAPLVKRWRWAMVTAAAVVLVATLLSIAPVRRAAAEFLGIFRVRKFAVIPIDPARLEQLAGMQDLVEAVLNKPTLLREPGQPQNVADAAAATAVAGFRVRTPATLPDGATRQTFVATTGPEARFVAERAQLEILLQAVGAEDVTLPDAEKITVTVDFASIVEEEYKVGNGNLLIVQTPSPAVTMVPDLDPAVLGESLLRFLGVSAEDAHRLAQEIDWTSTLVIPLPTNVAQFREVEVDGVTGVLLVGAAENAESRQGAAVLWQRDGIVYAVGGDNVASELLLQAANSLR